MNAVARAWRLRTDGERRFLAIALGVAVVLLLVAFAWLPLERARARDAAAIPQLQATLAAMKRDAEAVKRLRAQPARAASAPTSLASLAAANPIAGTQLSALDERRVRIVATDAAYAALIEGVAALGASHGLHVERARIDALAQPGRVSAELVLARP